ncbi:MAG TPA: type II toxin-antitoxin system HipA family toxin [Kofleriaceae bacterium]|nr:type II toxin-antitoxin system HipA family toxin [Kofleriaceae bacterium]
MKLQRIEQVAVFYEPAPARRRKVGRLALKGREILFEYDAAFLGSQLELSPFELPLRPGVVVGQPARLDGLMGLFDDSLPDGWGRLLIDRRAAELGLSGSSLTPLDRLALVGARSMGALIYEPELALEDPTVVKLSELAKEVELVLMGGSGGADLERLIAIGGSPKGARPKALVQLAPSGDVHFGARDIQPGFTAWLVKFRAPEDDPHVASLEHAYFLMAKAAGLEVPRTQVLGKTKRSAGYFAIERFDRDGAVRIHSHTLGGLLQLPHGYAALDYGDLLKITRRLTRNEAAVAEMFRRACFNVLAHNRDDHSRNFAFLMNERGGWRPSPAYDLTFAEGPGGEHTLLVAGEGANPGTEHLLTLAGRAELTHGAKIVDEVRAAVSRFREHADEAGVPAKLQQRIASTLAPTSTRGRRRRRRTPHS